MLLYSLLAGDALLQQKKQSRPVVSLNQDKRQVQYQNIEDGDECAARTRIQAEAIKSADAKQPVNQFGYAGFADHQRQAFSPVSLQVFRRHHEWQNAAHARNNIVPAMDADFFI